jgi:hypothetical protein
MYQVRQEQQEDQGLATRCSPGNQEMHQVHQEQQEDQGLQQDAHQVIRCIKSIKNSKKIKDFNKMLTR